MSGFKSIFTKLNPAQDKSLTFASVWKGVNERKKAGPASVESSPVLTSSKSSVTKASPPAMSSSTSSSVTASLDALVMLLVKPVQG